MTNTLILEFLGVANEWLKRNQEETKFRYAVAKIARKAERVKATIQETVDDINVENALEDTSTKKLLKNDRDQYEFSKEGMNKRNEAVRKLMQETNEITPHFSEPPDGLPSEFRIVFEGFVIKPEESNGG